MLHTDNSSILHFAANNRALAVTTLVTHTIHYLYYQHYQFDSYCLFLFVLKCFHMYRMEKHPPVTRIPRRVEGNPARNTAPAHVEALKPILATKQVHANAPASPEKPRQQRAGYYVSHSTTLPPDVPGLSSVSSIC